MQRPDRIGPDLAVQAVQRDHGLDGPVALAWVAAQRALLQGRVNPGERPAASSGCAAAGAAAHDTELAELARRALDRLEAGRGTRCESCDTVLSPERLDAVPSTTRCVRCPRPGARTVDPRWCR